MDPMDLMDAPRYPWSLISFCASVCENYSKRGLYNSVAGARPFRSIRSIGSLAAKEARRCEGAGCEIEVKPIENPPQELFLESTTTLIFTQLEYVSTKIEAPLKICTSFFLKRKCL